ncbi:MAG: TIGR04255 family protein, partial [Rhodanobacteraceae bacterium]
MSRTFQNAPLVEIVAELRWAAPGLSAKDKAGHAVIAPLTLTSAIEPFFVRISGAVAKRGFDRSESIVPAGPVLPHQMIYRYRRSDERPVLAQVGPGRFSVNALPPYKTWAEFRPWLEYGVQALLESLEGVPPLRASLRYIDAFGPNLTDGRTAGAFLTDVLGYK